jgi:hypothetical protein
MPDGRKYEIFLEMQQHNRMIFTKIVRIYVTATNDAVYVSFF